MTAPQYPPRPTPAVAPDPPPVRLDVRVGSARPVGRPVPATGFVVGGAEGSDLRLPGASLPPQLCRFDRTPTGATLQRLAPAVPVLVNGNPVLGTDPIPVRNGDVVAVGLADITVAVADTPYLRPNFVAFPPPAVEEAPQPEPTLPVLASSIPAPIASRPTAVLTERETELALREQELVRTRDELAVIRQSLLEQYQVRRDQLAQMQEVVRGAAAELEDRRLRFETELVQRRADMEAEFQRRAEAFDREMERRRADVLRQIAEEARLAEPRLLELRSRQTQLAAAFAELDGQREALAKDRATFDAGRSLEDTRLAERDSRLSQRETDLARREQQIQADRQALDLDREQYIADVIRFDRQRGEQEDRQQTLDRRAAEVDQRVEQLIRDSAELEETVRLSDSEQSRLGSESERLERVRNELETRAADLADRAARLEAQQAMLAVLRAKLDRQQEDFRQEATRLAADRTRHDDARADLQAKMRDAEALRSELAAARDGQAEHEKAAAERSALLEATLKELAEQQDALAADQARLKAKEDELDVRSGEIAEQAATLRARLAQVMDLQSRLEADRTAVREREVTLTDADSARVTFQEQLRRRAEDLAARARQFDETAARIATEEAALDRKRAEAQHERERAEQGLAAANADLTARAEELGRQAAALADREAALARQVDRLREAGRSVADGRKQLALARQKLDADQNALAEQGRLAREELDTLRATAAGQMEQLRQQVPELEEQATAAQERLTTARDVLRSHLAELHVYASQTRAELDAARAVVRTDAEALRDRETALETARSEHRLAVAHFRQQLTEWHARVSELKQAMARNESRIDAKHTEVTTATRTLDVTTQELARQAEELRHERQRLTERRTEVELHLSDMREWYRKKLRELAASNTERGIRNAESEPVAGWVGLLSSDSDSALRIPNSALEEVDPGDRQLGELLRSLELVDDDSLAGLWAEADRQRRTLRQVLLASGVVTLYQLALIEAGDLDALMLGRLRVVDRVRVTPREATYRVFDPTRADEPNRGAFLLRHLSESEAQDAVRPDEFRQRFAALRDAAHPNLAGTVEVLEIAGRPAALQEWVAGLPGSEWPTTAGVPGVWLRLVSQAAAGLDAAHRVGLAHGRLTSDAFVLTADGTVKLTGVGEPPWLAVGPEPEAEPTFGADLRALGQIAFGWAQLGQSVKRRGRPKAFPDPLAAVIRRLEADPDTPMSDTPSGAEPYRSASELVADLERLSAAYPCPSADWNALMEQVADAPIPLRRSA